MLPTTPCCLAKYRFGASVPKPAPAQTKPKGTMPKGFTPESASKPKPAETKNLPETKNAPQTWHKRLKKHTKTGQ